MFNPQFFAETRISYSQVPGACSDLANRKERVNKILYYKGEVPLCYHYCCLCHGQATPKDSETGWTGELWSKTNLFIVQNKDNRIFVQQFFKVIFLKDFLKIFFLFLWPFWQFVGFFMDFLNIFWILLCFVGFFCKLFLWFLWFFLNLFFFSILEFGIFRIFLDFWILWLIK